jgi:hypothetical protein
MTLNYSVSQPTQGQTSIILSRDGHIRLTFESFQQLEMVHLFSGMDADRPNSVGDGATSHPITGYTEWVSQCTPAISIGWDWELTGVRGKAQLVPTGTPASNLMFVDRHGYDLGPEQTRQLITAWLNTFIWQTETLKAVSA